MTVGNEDNIFVGNDDTCNPLNGRRRPETSVVGIETNEGYFSSVRVSMKKKKKRMADHAHAAFSIVASKLCIVMLIYQQ